MSGHQRLLIGLTRPQARQFVDIQNGARQQNDYFAEAAANPDLGPDDPGAAAIHAFSVGDTPTAPQLDALKKAMLRRPALRVWGTTIEELPVEARSAFGDVWPHAVPLLTAALPSVGLVEFLDGNDWVPVGTGFVLAPHALATNSHVVRGDGRKPGTTLFRVRFAFTETTAGPVFTLGGCVAEDEQRDVAVLKIRPSDEHQEPDPLALIDDSDEDLLGAQVALVGYPFEDPRGTGLAEPLLGDNYGHLAVSPGTVNLVQEITRDLGDSCTTAGGNSGSPMLRLSDGSVVGIHKKGFLLNTNRATNAQYVAAVRDLAVAGIAAG